MPLLGFGMSVYMYSFVPMDVLIYFLSMLRICACPRISISRSFLNLRLRGTNFTVLPQYLNRLVCWGHF